MNRIGIIFRGIVLSVLIAAGLCIPAIDVNAAANPPRPSVNGKLHVEGGGLVDENGTTVALHGVSTHGLTWYPQFVDNDLFRYVSKDWNADLVRLAMYSEIYCRDEDGKTKSLELMEKGIGYAIENDMYVIVDWHILNDEDPNMNLKQARDFFEYISEKYADEPAVIYEICNEPNGDTAWSDICDYADVIIPAIRKNAPDSLIIIGTPDYDRNVSAPIMAPLKYDNIMYALHFYSATHDNGLRTDAQYAILHGLPVFVTECGISESSGNGPIDYESAIDWFDFLNEHNISYAVWSLSNKDETSAMFKPTYEPSSIPSDHDLTESGFWIRQVISGTAPADAAVKTGTNRFLSDLHKLIAGSLGDRGILSVSRWDIFAVASLILILLCALTARILKSRRTAPLHTYEDILKKGQQEKTGISPDIKSLIGKIALIVSIFLTIIYFCWRIFFSVPIEYGVAAVISNLVLLIVEIIGFGESLILYYGLMRMKKYPVPKIEDDQYPDVDVFIASYNEPEDLLKKTINGCLHLKYPDKNKVHIWMCDDNRRANIRQLCEDMGIGYFDRPDNEGAKAGNLNHAMGLTSSPYVVTLDADMIPRSDFLLKTIPYFVDAELRMKDVKEEEKIRLGFLQTPQSFYTPDVFQHALYSERRAPNEQDFFYRTIEVSKTATNSVIYGGSNTVLSRKAIDEVGGFYTGSITEDFATGFLIEQKGYVSLATPEPLANGQAPCEYKEHIKQRIRWGRGVIATSKQLHILKSPDMTIEQKLSYLSSVSYWFSSLKTLIYILSPLLFAVFAIPVLKCNWLELIVYWLPVYIMQDVCLRLLSHNAMSLKWSGIYETGIMPHMIIPIIQEAAGFTLSAFKVTDKSGKNRKKQRDIKSMIPFIILAVLTVIGIIRVFILFKDMQIICLLILLFWLIRNLYFLIMSLFLVDGREIDNENVTVIDAEPVTVTVSHGDMKGTAFYGVTTRITDHNVCVYLDEHEGLKIGTPVDLVIETDDYKASFKGTVVNMKGGGDRHPVSFGIEILDYEGNELELDQILYDRVPTLPQSLSRDFGIIGHLIQNIAHRAARFKM